MSRDGVGHPPRSLLIPAAFAMLLIVLPLAGLLTHVSWSTLPGEIQSDEVRTAVGLSLQTSLLALGLSLMIGVPLALILARTTLPGRRLLRVVVLVPLVLPPVVGGIALQTAFGRDTVIGRMLGAFGLSLPFTTAGAALAEAFVALPFLVLTVEAGLRQSGTRFEEVAADLGAGPWGRFLRVTLPLMVPSLIAGSALCWARALGEFGATITFAGSFPGTTETLPLAAYAAFEGSGQAERAITLSFLLLAISLAVLAALRGRLIGPAA